jgi:hypothetical protein
MAAVEQLLLVVALVAVCWVAYRLITGSKKPDPPQQLTQIDRPSRRGKGT